nr:hypothetical protein HmN_000117400 [Hymenolepis microstoma]
MPESLGPNFKQSTVFINTLTKLGIEMFQTDTLELSNETPDLTDESNTLEVNIHGFPPEHATATCKRRDERERQTPKFPRMSPTP